MVVELHHFTSTSLYSFLGYQMKCSSVEYDGKMVVNDDKGRVWKKSNPKSF